MKAKSKSVGGLSLLPRFRVMRGKEIAFGPGKMALLEIVAKTGLITEAAKRIEMSYMRAWSLRLVVIAKTAPVQMRFP